VTFRGRLLLAAMVTLAVGVGALAVIGNVLLAARVHGETSNLLRTRADGLAATLVVRGGRVVVRAGPNDAALDRDAWVFDGARVIERPSGVDPRVDRRAIALGRQAGTAEVEAGDDVRLRSQPVQGSDGKPAGAVVVGVSEKSVELLREQVLAGSAVLGMLILVAGALALRSAISGALSPVMQMTVAAEDWGAHDLERRFDLGPPRDELTTLAATLDGLLTRIAASRRHEQRFADDVAHELRTPLATLRAQAELGLRSEQDSERRESLERVLAETERLSVTVETLLRVGRRELDPTAYAVDLEPIAREVEGVEVLVSAGLPAAEGEPDVIRRALAPLVDNARRHARGPVRLELGAGQGRVWIAVRDDGPGPDPALGVRVFEPGVRGESERGDGVGLGLPLARRLARSCGGDVRLGNGPGGCFVLELRSVP
jgi:signal transduction histidine kinase